MKNILWGKRPLPARGDPRRHEQGTVLVLALMISVLMAILAIPYMSKLSGRFKTSERIADTLAARYLAEAGVEMALWELNYGNISSWSGSSSQRTLTIANVQSSAGTVIGSVSIVVYDPQAAEPVIESTGSVGHSGSATIDETVRVVLTKPPDIYNVGIFGNNWVKVKEQSRIDSYDSSLGPYGGGNVGAGALVGSNTPGAGRIEIKDTSSVGGDAVCGFGLDPATEIVVDAGATLTGTKTAMAAPRTYEPAVAPTGLPNRGNINVDKGQILNIDSSGKYGTFEISGKSTVNITADVTLHLTTKLKLGDGCTLNVANGAKLTVVLDNNDNNTLELHTGSRLTSVSHKPSDFSIVGTTNCTGDLFFDSLTAFYGNVYLPKARFHFDGTPNVYGSVLAKEFELKGSTFLHYDTSLQTFLPGGAPIPPETKHKVKSWQGTL